MWLPLLQMLLYHKTMKTSRLVKPVLILPGTVLVFVPAIILIATYDTRFSFEFIGSDRLLFWPGVVAACLGLALAFWTVSLFTKFGQGTPAPWDPPQKLVVRGPYRYVRNPMITSVLFMLTAESLLLQSWPIFLWLLTFSRSIVSISPYLKSGLWKKGLGRITVSTKKMSLAGFPG